MTPFDGLCHKSKEFNRMERERRCYYLLYYSRDTEKMGLLLQIDKPNHWFGDILYSRCGMEMTLLYSVQAFHSKIKSSQAIFLFSLSMVRIEIES